MEELIKEVGLEAVLADKACNLSISKMLHYLTAEKSTKNA